MAERTQPIPTGSGRKELPEDFRSELDRWMRAALEGPEYQSALYQVTAEIARHIDADRCTILAPIGAEALRVLASSDDESLDDLLVSLDRYPELRYLLDSGEPILIRDLKASELLRPVRGLLPGTGAASLAAVLLRLPDFTAILRISSESRSLAPTDLSTLREVAHHIERALHARREPGPDEISWANLVWSLSDAVLEVALDGRVTDARGNATTPFGRTVMRLEGKPLSDAFEDPDLEDVLELLRATGEPRQLTASIEDSVPIPVVAVAVPCLVPPLRVRIALRALDTEGAAAEPLMEALQAARGDASERESRMEATLLRQIEEMEGLRRQVDELAARRTLFLSASAHELKTPITVLQVYIETMMGELSEGMNDEQLEFLKICHESVLRLRRLVLDLVDLAALESGDIELDVDRVVLQPLLASVVSEMQPLAMHAGVRLVMDCPGNLPAARVDAARFQQVVCNLLDNAIKNTPADGIVTATCSREEDRLVLRIADTGIGIPQEQLDEIFQEFGPTAATDDRRDRGAGLGLAVSRRLIAAIGGKITAESNEGEGSVFTVYLPEWPDD
jgi:signal transduction histidine kinase